ncbi:hypothetical protein M1437_02670 [Patescibacteria group bacterium]|nr:hypothetical protein [Patescibacteria group bacterium]
MQEGDEAFLRSAGERMEGYFPGLSERIDKLNMEQLGRGIVLKHFQEGARSSSELIAYILPVSKDQREHVILFKSGDIFVTSVPSPGAGALSTQADADKYYTNKMAPSPVPIEVTDFKYSNIGQVVGDINAVSSHNFWSRITGRNSDPASTTQVLAKVDQAIIVAKETKAERDRAKEESAKQLLAKIDEFLNPKKPEPPESIPPL